MERRVLRDSGEILGKKEGDAHARGHATPQALVDRDEQLAGLCGRYRILAGEAEDERVARAQAVTRHRLHRRANMGNPRALPHPVENSLIATLLADEHVANTGARHERAEVVIEVRYARIEQEGSRGPAPRDDAFEDRSAPISGEGERGIDDPDPSRPAPRRVEDGRHGAVDGPFSGRRYGAERAVG